VAILLPCAALQETTYGRDNKRGRGEGEPPEELSFFLVGIVCTSPPNPSIIYRGKGRVDFMA
jgi:hypothetical protein